VLWDDTTQNNQYLIEIQKLNNKIMLRAKVLQWACHRSEAEPHCTFGAAAGSKKPLARQKGSARATQRNAYSRHVLGPIRRKIPVRHLILFKFFELSWLADDAAHRSHP
jgi:ribosomal protein L4